MPVNVTSSVHFRPGGPGATANPSTLEFSAAVPAAALSAGVPYVLPGTVGYLGTEGALTPYSPAGSGLPGAGNAPAGFTWQAYGLRNDSDFTLDHVHIYGGIYTNAANITVTNSVIQAGTGTELACIAAHASSGPGVYTVHDSTLNWLGAMNNTSDISPIWDSGGIVWRYDVQRCDLSTTPQGLNPSGSDDSGNPSQVIDCWIHNLVQNNAGTPNHMDGIFCQGRGYLTIRGCYIDCPVNSNQTACLFFQDNTNDPGYVVDGNYLSGSGFGFENQSGTGVVVTNNVFAGNALNGDAINRTDLNPAASIGTWTGNHHPDGSAVPSP